jgi:hypothetical protein
MSDSGSETRSGGCLCGAIRYEIPWPPAAIVACHCKDCQRQAGTVMSVIAAVPRDAVKVTGTLKTFDGQSETGDVVYRRFCGDCGSPIMSEIPRGQSVGLAYIKAGTLDDNSGLLPAAHVWASSAQDWFPFPDGAVKIDKQ